MSSNLLLRHIDVVTSLFSLVIDEELNKKLENHKWEMRKSKNQLIACILTEYFNNLEKNERNHKCEINN